MRGTNNPITKTLAALAIGATMFASQGCAGRAMTGLLETAKTVAKSGKAPTRTTISADDWSQMIKGTAKYNSIQVIATQDQYDKYAKRSFEIPVLLATYSRFDNNAGDAILTFCHYTPLIPIEKGVIADDAVELEGIVGKVLKSGQNVIILDKGKAYGCKLEDLPAWVSAYKLVQEKASANK